MSDKSSQRGPSTPQSATKPSTPQSATKMLRTISSSDLMGGDKVIIIRHEQEDYRLRITAANKLILTK